MKKNKIVVIEPMFSKNALLKSEIQKKFKNVYFNKKKIKEVELKRIVKNADGVILGLQNFDKNIIDSAKDLKIIAKFGVGVDNIDLIYAKKKGVKIKRALNCNKVAVAELVLSNMINLQRSISVNNDTMKKSIWKKVEGGEIFQKKIAIVGLGNTGKEVAKRLKPFNCKIYVNDITYDEKFIKKYKLKKISFENALKYCDIITFHVPFTNLTCNMVNNENIKFLRKNTIVINTSRGSVIDVVNLSKKIIEKNLRIAIDVYKKEPLRLKKNLLKIKESIFTPHIGGTTIESKLRIGRKNISDLSNFFKK
jgi:phosphoglycerate dehydrogenase-like enzyme